MSMDLLCASVDIDCPLQDIFIRRNVLKLNKNDLWKIEKKTWWVSNG